jgi:two-component system sensor histidine kinase DesK
VDRSVRGAGRLAIPEGVLTVTTTLEPTWGPRQWLRYRLYGLVFLLFLTYPVTAALHLHSPVRTGVGLVGVAGFAACFTRVVWQAAPDPHRNRTPYALVGGLLIGAATSVLVGFDMFVSLAFYANSLLILSLSRRWWLRSVVAVTTAYLTVGLLTGQRFGDVFGLGVTIFSVGWLMTAFYMQIQDTRQLRTARAELARLAVAEERLRIARDLHDVLGQRLAAVALKSDLAVRLLRAADRAGAEREMAEVGKVAREALDEVRQTVSGYRGATLDAEVHTAAALLSAAGVEVTLSGVPVDLPADVEETASWVVREAVTNVVRHAHAGRCRITLGRHQVEVSDDGVGDTVAYGNGLSGMAERVAAVGGQLTVGPVDGWFTVRATMPA